METAQRDFPMDYVPELSGGEGSLQSKKNFRFVEGKSCKKARHYLLTSANIQLKRFLDILFSLLLGLLFLPIILLTALLIRLDSPGPIFFKQERLGKDGRKFKIFKFRSMLMNSDNLLIEYIEKNTLAQLEWDQNQKLHNDPRVTRVGKWIREFSVDEIPQVLNILKGDMSLVGPRPILVDQEKLYGEAISIYRSVRPGLTGYWQVCGRNLTTFQQRVLYDVYYVDNWSFWLDMYILFRTIGVVLSRVGAC